MKRKSLNAHLFHLYRRTNLVRIIRRHLYSKRNRSVTFLRWYSPDDEGSRESLPVLTKLLHLPLIILPAHYSVTDDARLLLALAEKLCPEKRNERPEALMQLTEALEHLPYSALLEDCALTRIGVLAKQRRLAIATLGTGPAASSAIGRMLEWTCRLGLHTVLVLAHTKPDVKVSTVTLPLPALYEDINTFITSQQGVPKARATPATIGPRQPVKFTPPPSFYRKLLNYLRGVPRQQVESEQITATATESRTPVQGGHRSVVQDWAELLARLSEPNWAIAREILQSWATLDQWLQKHYRTLSKDSNRLSDGLLPNNSEEREMLESRLRFLLMLKTLYPPEFHAALHELDGTDQLYRLHLILSGHAAADSLLASSLLPFWQCCLKDPFFKELFYSCFDGTGRGNSLVARFESRSQLHRLLVQADGQQSAESRQEIIAPLVRAHADWVGKLASFAEPAEQENAPDVKNLEFVELIRDRAVMGRDDLSERAGKILSRNPTATDALQAAQLLLSAYELTFDIEEDRAKSVFPLIQELTDTAINRSKAAIRTDALLLRARSLALRGKRDDALEVLRRLRLGDPLVRCAALVEEAFVEEKAGDFFAAIRLYQEVLNIAEPMGADELVARAASGCLRCDTESSVTDKKLMLPLRARIVIQIQSARAPELFPMSKRDKPRIFLSYRSHSQEVTEALQDRLRKISLEPWNDTKLKSYEDFNPVIHRRLYDSDAIILLLSRHYFDSPWCVHELHFALGQHELRGVPLYWAWCEEVSNDAPRSSQSGDGNYRETSVDTVKFDPLVTCDRRAQLSIEETFPNTDTQRHGYELKHVQDRLRRLFAYGQLLSAKPIPFEPVAQSLEQSKSRGRLGPQPSSPAFDSAIDTSVAAMKRAREYLYKRARLNYVDPTAERPPRDPPDSPSPGPVQGPSPSPAGVLDLADDLANRNPASVFSGVNTEGSSLNDQLPAANLDTVVQKSQVESKKDPDPLH
jgi:hypothetical protein